MIVTMRLVVRLALLVTLVYLKYGVAESKACKALMAKDCAPCFKVCESALFVLINGGSLQKVTFFTLGSRWTSVRLMEKGVRTIIL